MADGQEAPPDPAMIADELRPIFWRRLLERVAHEITVPGAAKAVEKMDDETVEIFGHALVLSIFGPLADVGGRLAFRASDSYGEERERRLYPEDPAAPSVTGADLIAQLEDGTRPGAQTMTLSAVNAICQTWLAEAGLR